VRIDRVLAPNPGVFTGPGTNTYVVGDASTVAVIDPGPVDDGHEQAIVHAVGSRVVVAVIVTHTHPDHAPLANPLARSFGVAAHGHAPGPEFEPDVVLMDGSAVSIGPVRMEAIHTPGHSDDHLCLRVDDVLFTGDHIMGGSSVMVDDVAPYMASLDRLSRLPLTRLYPGHGPEMDHPSEVISWYLAHRRQREAEILASVGAGHATIGAVVEHVYADVDTSLYPLAARSVAAHLRKLRNEGLVELAGDDWGSGVNLSG
jgi:glyoxylase-like metal-dependent hydrolase (beta-lactamase superfamily II)